MRTSDDRLVRWCSPVSLSHRDEKRLRVLQQAIEKVNESYAVVEGKRDCAALEKIGVIRERMVVLVTVAHAIEAVVEQKGTTVVILTDFDRQGEELVVALKAEAEAHGLRADAETRKDFRYALRLRCFEEAYSRYRELLRACGGYHGKSLY